MKEIGLLAENLPAYGVASRKMKYEVVDLRQAASADRETGYIDKHGVMLMPFCIFVGKHLELMCLMASWRMSWARRLPSTANRS